MMLLQVGQVRSGSGLIADLRHLRRESAAEALDVVLRNRGMFVDRPLQPRQTCGRTGNRSFRLESLEAVPQTHENPLAARPYRYVDFRVVHFLELHGEAVCFRGMAEAVPVIQPQQDIGHVLEVHLLAPGIYVNASIPQPGNLYRLSRLVQLLERLFEGHTSILAPSAGSGAYEFAHRHATAETGARSIPRMPGSYSISAATSTQSVMPSNDTVQERNSART